MLLLPFQITSEKVDTYSDRVSERFYSTPEVIQRMPLSGETKL
jgi:hypothetical protein